ncbi:response regulator transcription factor [Rhizobium leucaenae]|nr:response regulator [Rhizobium leucaenae]
MYSLTSTTHDRCSKPSVLEANKPVVFIIDDDVSVRESLEQLIRSAGWAPVIFDSARQFLECASTRGPSCLILDVNMPGVSGLELQRTIVAEGISVPIIFITGFGDVPMTVRAMKAGAVEFLTKPIDTEALLKAVRAALIYSETVSREEEGLALLQQAYALLSPRERDVMRRVVKGLLNKQVAFELGISEITVKAHRGQVMRKMNARSLPDLVNMAARLHLSDDELIH